MWMYVCMFGWSLPLIYEAMRIMKITVCAFAKGVVQEFVWSWVGSMVVY